MKAACFAALVTLALPAAADSFAVPASAAWKAECGSCHLAYPPQLLPASSWKRLMSDLERHFGTDASLDAKTHEEISGVLAAYAGRRAPPPGAEPRITATRWFRKEHGAVRDPANCTACHAQAERGIYDDD